MNTIYVDTVQSPAGPLHVSVTAAGELIGVDFGCTTPIETVLSRHQDAKLNPDRCRQISTQIAEYVRRERTTFDIDLCYTGSDWEMAVWGVLLTIPYGETRSYGQIATQLGDPSKARAVGWANHVNPIPLVIPCHRVIGAQGNLTGFGGGIDAKIQLLAHEGVMLPGFA
jgi:methylated-DNA-[protein]-cysteine S-methyltransferase